MIKLSKSKYVGGLNCPKVLWLQAHRPKEAAKPDPGTLHRFHIGHLIGRYAHQLFPGGVLVEEDHKKIDQAITRTRELMDQGAPALFEAAVEHDNVRCRADVIALVRDQENLWDLYEVKSTTKVKDEHHPDVAVQRYCFEGAGYPIRNTFLTHVNNEYVRRGEIEPDKLLVHQDLTDSDKTSEELERVPALVEELLGVQNQETCPRIEPGSQCHSPHTCEFYDLCNDPTEPYTVHELSRGRIIAAKLEKMGITMLADIPDDFPLNRRQRKHVESAKKKRAVVDPEGLRRHLNGLEYPVHFLDFETLSSAVPLFDETRPYQNIPFQFSLHIQQEPGGECTHKWFLQKERDDPREELIKAMLTGIGPRGSIVAYNAPFEKHCINELARDLPAYADELNALVPRLWDLIVPFRNGDYAHYECHGSASLKAVLPAVVPDLSYDELEVQGGMDASILGTRWYLADMSPEKWQEVRQQLLDYCHLDTLATVKILNELHRLAGNGG